MDSLQNVEEFATKHSDGHFTLMRFTTNWRAGFFTPSSREDIERMQIGATAHEAISKAMGQLFAEQVGGMKPGEKAEIFQIPSNGLK